MTHSIQPNLEAGGDIRPYRIIKVSTAADNQCLESDANELSIGVVAGSTRQFDSANHAEDGDHVTLQMGSIVNVECGGSITRGNSIESDADGKAVAETASGTLNRHTCGIALESGASGEIIRMLWRPKTARHDLS
jgi:hypothetical protein